MNALCDVTASTLILVDLQTRLMPAIHDGQAVASRAAILARAAKLLDVPIVATEQSPASLGHTVSQLQELCDTTIAKSHFDASTEAAFIDSLAPQRDELIVAGCEAHVCVMQTVLGLLERDYRVWLVTDAIGSRHPHDLKAAIDRAGATGARLVTTEMVIFEWMRDSHHPAFKSLLELVK
ncbi:Nicotinamidase-related amidase [Modicisalibacter muralis]|uniref:Nicotinamidase-related amidase n=1 Tax=Modicisalibacter muralis TaxID=119000 RepID=A0A1G9H371_9GAMM|nr:isochorismatase family protein [Halomonas muralis]SDL07387.1 Nicotinamidase-related amidase [Halomonas muralis]